VTRWFVIADSPDGCDTLDEAARQREQRIVLGDSPESLLIVRTVETRVVEAHDLDGEAGVRGEQLRHVIADWYRENGKGPHHYKTIMESLEQAGIVVGGKNPGATMLTQLVRAGARPVGVRSGLYELDAREPG